MVNIGRRKTEIPVEVETKIELEYLRAKKQIELKRELSYDELLRMLLGKPRGAK